MYDNSVRLIGFLGKDAEVKTTKSGNEYTVLSLATQASWKDKKSGEYVNRTEWHRMIAWANLSTFAATLKKGTHLSVEGELRYREFNDKKHKKVKVRLAEIHLGKIGKLDRAAARVAGQWRGDPLLGASALAVLWFGVTHSLEREAPVKTAS